MVFSSHVFVYYFLPLALLAYFAVPPRWRNLVLVLVSFVFYGWVNPAFSLLLTFTMLVDYCCGLALTGGFRRPWRGELPMLEPGGPRSRMQRAALATSIVVNLAVLAFFKYFNFAVDSWNGLLAALGIPQLQLDTTLRVALPLGISFFTFQYLSYAIDVYRGEARAVRNLIDFSCFESMYPQLVAGPIIRYQEVAEQLLDRTVTMAKFARGVAFFSLGMGKKILLANPCGKVADLAFDAGSVGLADAWFGLASYAFQIYFDFSGYSDMAIGLGLMLGFMYPKNFDSPYKADSLTDFWRRWHLSLSTWLRDYLYIPLGGNRRGPVRTYGNLLTVMVVGGLWHGASWSFVIWGALHGTGLAVERALGRPLWAGLPRPLRVGATFVVVLLTWVFFRAGNLDAALAYLGNLFGAGTVQEGAALLGGVLYQPYYVLTFVLAAAIAWTAPQTWDWTGRLTWAKGAACVGVLAVALVAMASQGYNPFIYFIF
jgi:alginate O-acetyltransferase complex protein AlgI